MVRKAEATSTSSADKQAHPQAKASAARSSTGDRISPPTGTSRVIPITSKTAPATSSKPQQQTQSQSRPASVIVRSPPNTANANTSAKAGPSSRRYSQPNRSQSASTSGAGSGERKKRHSSSSSRSPADGPTPTSSANSSRRSSVVLDSSAYRYSLNVGSISRFPAASTGDVSGSGANQILAAAERRGGTPRIGIEPPSSSRSSMTVKDNGDNGGTVLLVDPSRASVSSTASSTRSSSRMSSRYMAEEVAPQRRPVYLALPSDPSAVGVWSSTNTSSAALNSNKSGTGVGDKDAPANGKPERRDSKIMTTFPFPHPVTPRRRADRTGTSSTIGGSSNGSSRFGLTNLNAAWQRLLTAIFAGPYERQLNREEQEDDAITQSIIQDIAERRGSGTVATGLLPNYGAIPVPKTNTMESIATTATNTSAEGEEDPNDPYGYRRLAGPHLLPSYTTDLVARRRERRRARSRARFQCMALWTIWTVSVVLLIIVGVILFSWYFPDKLDIPSHHDDGDDDDDDDDEGDNDVQVNAAKVMVKALGFKGSLLTLALHQAWKASTILSRVLQSNTNA